VEELLISVSSEELTEWAAYYQLDPFGSYRGDLQAGTVASTMANIHAKKGHRFTPTDFMPKFGVTDETKRMTPQEIHARLSTMMKSRP
jgi:hypothetical protein